MLRVSFAFEFVYMDPQFWRRVRRYAETPVEVLAEIKSEASATPGFQGFSAARGESFFEDKQNQN